MESAWNLKGTHKESALAYNQYMESEISRVSEWNKEPSLKANNQQEIGQELISQQIQASMTCCTAIWSK